jgi:hypothetical protein
MNNLTINPECRFVRYNPDDSKSDEGSGQSLWGTVEFWATDSRIPLQTVRDRLEPFQPCLMRVRLNGRTYPTDAYSEAAFLEACTDLLVASRAERSRRLVQD